MKNNVPLLVALAALVSFIATPAAFAQGTAFTYQGQLQDGGNPASGTYNLTFTLFNTNITGVAIAGPVTNNAVIITNGLFTVQVDFGFGVFTGATNWLQTGVATNGVSSFTPLTPRQQLTPTLYAIYAESVAASGIIGTLVDSQLTHSAVTVNPGPGLSGGGRVGLGNTVVLTNNGVLSVTGNADITATTVGGAVTLGDTASSADTAGTLVKRDGSGNFSAASITLDGALTLPAIAAGSPDIIYSGGNLLLYDDNNGNLFGGNAAGNSGTSGFYNTANGNGALAFNASGSYNTANGSQALFFNSGGSDNTAVGFETLSYNSGGSDNTANGYEALFSNTNGTFNTANGSQALHANTSGSENTADGGFVLYNNTVGIDNTANGYGALYSSTNGSYNTAIGMNSLEDLTAGSNNIALGFVAGGNITTGSGNIDIGNAGLATDTNIIRIGSGQTQTYIAGVINGNGAGLTGLTTATIANYVHSYSTTTQAVVTISTFQDITNNVDVQISGWTHAANTTSFTNAQTGLYLVQYTAEATTTTTAASSVSLRAVVNGTEIADSQSSASADTASLVGPISKSFIASFSPGDILKFQLAGSSTSDRIVSSTGSGTTRPSFSCTIIRIQ
jgi:hypothetical protein